MEKPVGSGFNFLRNRFVLSSRKDIDKMILKETNQLTTESKLIVLEHHEREDGRGYPYGLYGGEIHEYARICALVDMYDALTSDRPYRQKMTPCQALNLIKGKLADRTQKALFETLVLVLGEN